LSFQVRMRGAYRNTQWDIWTSRLRGDELVGKADEGQFQLRHGGGGIWWHFLDEAHYHADIYEAGVFVSQSWRQRRFIAKGAHPKQVGVMVPI
jgi:hypothetical protein